MRTANEGDKALMIFEASPSTLKLNFRSIQFIRGSAELLLLQQA